MLSRKKRLSRPVDFGPYPLERLRRDPNTVAVEAARPATPPKPMTSGGSKYLVTAINQHLGAYEELREPEPFAKEAPVPDDLPRRSADIKGAGYFLDASQMGICAMPDSAWLEGVADAGTHAVVILVEYSAPIDSSNIAAGWVDGNAHLIATLRAAEIAACLSGQISSMGFVSKCHWTGASDVDLDKLTVLAGLAIRNGDDLINPYLDRRFAVSVITTSYDLNCDDPLHIDARNGRDLNYRLGLSGAVSGLERWRRKRRPSHLGPYPVEDLKRVDRPTTLIIDDEVSRVPSRANFYMRTALGDLSEKTKGQANRWSQKQPVAQGIVRPMWGVKPLQEGQTAETVASGVSDAEENMKALKALSHYMGSAITGICEIPDYCWYSHDKRGDPIDPYHKFALTVLIDQGHETVLGASGNDWISGAQSMRSYLRGAEVVGVMAAMIREMGYPARAHSSLDSHVLHVPLVLNSGLGEQSRIGESALNPFLGMRFKTAVLTTDMPLTTDKPIDVGLQTFCGSCLKCARECPSQAIPYGDKVKFNGYETWKPDTERCTSYRATNLKGSSCGRCIHICPLTKDITLDGPILHQVGSWLGVHAMWLKPVLAPIAIWLDDVLGHGNPINAKKWWLDLEVMGDKTFKYDPKNYTVAAKDANRPNIDPKKKAPKQQKMAYYPASTLPPPDLLAAFPLDRKQGMKHAAEAETVQEALARRASGGEKPATYIPSYETNKSA
ncbi:MAG: Fe-S protein [Alphaproteobacteria bacterium]|nr:Fe-S protein [Alphaproteobacteria bacterium]